jgi:hypothetical protein
MTGVRGPRSTSGNVALPRLVLGCWLAGLASIVALLVTTGSDHPGSPPLLRPREWSLWLAERHPIDSAAGMGRVAAVALVGYLILVTLLQLLSFRAHRPNTRSWSRQLSPRFVAVLVAASLTGVAPAAAGERDGGSVASAPTSPGLGAWMEVIEEDAGTSLPWAAEPLPPPPQTAPPLADRPPTAQPQSEQSDTDRVAPGEWLVAPGDHLWSIAERAVTASGAGLDEREVRRYWLSLIEANRERLIDPADPDVILPGQRLILP